MLGFLRRKDKRGRAAQAPPSTQAPAPQPTPLRDRNTPTNNARYRAAQAHAQGRNVGGAKENAAGSEENRPQRKMRGGLPPQHPTASPQGKSRRPRFNKHEPAVNNKVLTNDRRKSYKAAPPVDVELVAARPSMDKPTHHRRPSGDKLPSGNAYRAAPAKTPTAASNSPHMDMVNALRRDDMNSVGTALRRVLQYTGNKNSKQKMVEGGLALALISTLKHKEAGLDIRRTATAVIAELALEAFCEKPLVEAGTVPVLVWLINPKNNTDRLTLASACRALRNLLSWSEPTAVLATKYGCVEPLHCLIDGRSGRPEEYDVVHEASAALANLATHGMKFQRYVIKHQGLKSLNTLGIKTRNEDALYHIVHVLAVFAQTEHFQALIVAAGGLKTAFRALAIAKDLEITCEAARLIGNVAVTKKSRTAVREAGGAAALVARLATTESYSGLVPAYDLCRAIINVCSDPRAASDALQYSDAATVLLRVYTDQAAPEQVVKRAARALCVLASGSSNRRARVLYAIGTQLRQDSSRPTDRLYDLRQVILEEETDVHSRQPEVPVDLQRLSRASIRLINSGVAPQGRTGPPPSTKPPRNGRDPRNMQQPRPMYAQQPAHQYPERPEYAFKKNDRAKFRSTGRVLSVAQPRRPRAAGAGQVAAQSQAKQRAGDEDEDYVIPRANEQAIADSANARNELLSKETDGGFEKQFFEVGQQLGKGGYGSVFLAKDLRTGELVAIKQFHQNGNLVDRKALKEQRIWKGLHHPNVVEFKGSFVGDKGSLNLVVEYVDGLSLADHLSQYPAFPETLVAEITRQVLHGLQYLHSNGVTHRDLKPANILVDNNASVKICDFGVSRSDNVQTLNPGNTHLCGTPWYIAPEMIEYRPYTTSVDIWSLGCTVLELATGRRPYHELSAMQVLFRMVEDRRPPIPANLTPECRSFLEACWVWDHDTRPSAAALLKHPFIASASMVPRRTQ